jgi:hypothetical protein
MQIALGIGTGVALAWIAMAVCQRQFAEATATDSFAKAEAWARIPLLVAEWSPLLLVSLMIAWLMGEMDRDG